MLADPFNLHPLSDVGGIVNALRRQMRFPRGTDARNGGNLNAMPLQKPGQLFLSRPLIQLRELVRPNRWQTKKLLLGAAQLALSLLKSRRRIGKTPPAIHVRGQNTKYDFLRTE